MCWACTVTGGVYGCNEGQGRTGSNSGPTRLWAGLQGGGGRLALGGADNGASRFSGGAACFNQLEQPAPTSRTALNRSRLMEPAAVSCSSGRGAAPPDHCLRHHLGGSASLRGQLPCSALHSSNMQGGWDSKPGQAAPWQTYTRPMHLGPYSGPQCGTQHIYSWPCNCNRQALRKTRQNLPHCLNTA